ncbi:helix-turn-helix domain-containing protein [Oceanobacillus damuensis]|uniref:helix-turn-helix domain-containing protein n=1 Tax=Oceanobacillus damuensis TaxID=937928 RepID=UPI00082B65E2|nr:helix-turn-helix transcriptional regulator [Oceanobacillus damuensis]
MDTKRVGKRVKAFRKLKGYTQIDFAKELDVPTALIGNIERGTKAASDDLLDQIAEKLSIPREEITLENSGNQSEE